ncbi:MAG: hypothetical protein J6M60_06660 [Clostridia bacterium]|nr:hypothetical protein [Clostridia bacterium]
MNKIYFLQISCDFNEEMHYENVYSSKEKAIKDGKKELKNMLRSQYEELFEKEKKVPKLSLDELFSLNAIYDFRVTEFNPEIIDKLDNLNNLIEVEEIDLNDNFSAKLKPSKIEYSYNYKGKLEYISGIFIFKYNGKKKEYKISMKYDDYIDKNAGTKFKKGDIVKIKNNEEYDFKYKLHVICDTPKKINNQKFFNNLYKVITNHNRFDEGCHVDNFKEEDLELYTEKLPKDSPLVFLSKYFKGEIKLKNIEWIDIECGLITLNEMRSFRDIPKIMEQMKE